MRVPHNSSGLRPVQIRVPDIGGTKFRPVSHMGLAGWPCAKLTPYQRITDRVTSQDFDPLV